VRIVPAVQPGATTTRLHVIDGVGHLPHVEAQRETIDVLLQWLADVVGGGAPTEPRAPAPAAESTRALSTAAALQGIGGSTDAGGGDEPTVPASSASAKAGHTAGPGTTAAMGTGGTVATALIADDDPSALLASLQPRQRVVRA